MSQANNSELNISGSGVVTKNESFTLVMEPWADEYIIQPNDDVVIRVIGDHSSGSFRVTTVDSALIVWLEFDCPVDFQFWRNGNLEDESNNPT